MRDVPTELPGWARSRTPAGPAVADPRGLVARRTALGQMRLPAGIVPLVFGTDNLGASAAAEQLYRAYPGAAATFAQTGVLTLFRGSVVGMALRANAPKTAGVATFEAYVEAVASGAQMSWGNVNAQTQTFPAGRYPFATSDEVDVRVTTDSAFLPTTVDLELILFIAQTTTEAQP